MHKDDLLTMIADTAYDVGFGAKKHFATYDIVVKMPGVIGFISMALGIYSLFMDIFTGTFITATLIIWGIVVLYISFYNNEVQKYEDAGVKLIKIFKRLKQLYFEAKNCSESDLIKHQTEYQKLEDEFYNIAISKQIMFSDWYAHYKFFCQQEIKWLNEQKKFKLFSDKIPKLLSLIIFIAIVATIIYHFELLTLICSLIN